MKYLHKGGHVLKTTTPILLIRKVLADFKLNLASQTFIGESVPSLKKLLTINNKIDIVSEGIDALYILFEPYGIDLSIDIFTKDSTEDVNLFYLHIQITYEDNMHEDVLIINNAKLVDNFTKHKEELIIDKGL